jgi:hypothetical protein
VVDIKLLKCPACGSSDINKIDPKSCNCNHCGSSLILSKKKLTAVNPKKDSTKGFIDYLAIFIVSLIVLSVSIFVIGILYFLINSGYKLLSSDGDSQSTIVETNKQSSHLSSKVELNSKVKILSQVVGNTPNGNLFWIVKVKNIGSTNIKDISAVVSLFDEQDRRIEEKKSWSLLKYLTPQQETEIVVSVANPPKKYSRVEINSYFKKTDQQPNQVVIDIEDFIVKENRGKYDVIGDIKNPYDYELINLNVIAVALDSEGISVGHGYKYATRLELPAQEISGFKVNVHTYLTQKPLSWKVYAIARNK